MAFFFTLFSTSTANFKLFDLLYSKRNLAVKSLGLCWRFTQRCIVSFYNEIVFNKYYKKIVDGSVIYLQPIIAVSNIQY